MGIALEQSENSSVLRLDGVIDISCAAELKTLLLKSLSSGGEIRIALDGVTELDVTAVQLLWAAEREAARAAVAFALSGPMQEPVLSGLRLTGFEEYASTMDLFKPREVIRCQP